MVLFFIFFIFANKLKTYSMDCNLENIKIFKMRFVRFRIVLELPNSEELQDSDFLLLNDGNIIHSSNKKYASVDEVEVINTEGELIGRYFRSDVEINDPNTAVVWSRLN